MRAEHPPSSRQLLDRGRARRTTRPSSRRYGSARRLYNFHVDNATSY